MLPLLVEWMWMPLCRHGRCVPLVDGRRRDVVPCRAVEPDPRENRARAENWSGASESNTRKPTRGRCDSSDCSSTTSATTTTATVTAAPLSRLWLVQSRSAH